MEIGAYGLASQQMWDVYTNSSAAQAVNPLTGQAQENASVVTSSGDSVSISKEALALYANSYQSSHVPGDAAEPVQGASVQPGAEGAGAADAGHSSSEASAIERQVQALQNQIASLTSIVGSDPANPKVVSEISSLQAQVLTLQAQLM